MKSVVFSGDRVVWFVRDDVTPLTILHLEHEIQRRILLAKLEARLREA